MAVRSKLVAEKRVELGTAACRRLRRQGIIPGNLYGRGAEPVSISLTEDQVHPVVQSGAQVVGIEREGKLETAIIREVQWNTFGTHIEHVDLVRVDPNERVTVDVTIELRGVAPGVAGGGILDQPLHTLRIDCPAIDIPEKLTVRIGNLEVGEAIHASDLEVPEGIDVQTAGEAVVVRVTRPMEVEEPEAVEAAPAEPEVIGKKEEETESTDSP